MSVTHKSLFAVTAASRKFFLMDSRHFGSPLCSAAQCAPSTDILRPASRPFSLSLTALAPPPKKGSAFKAGMTVQKKKIEVETDPHKLVNYLCGGQYLKEGPEIKLGADNEYPEWLWGLRTTTPPSLEELDPNTLEYWLLVRKLKEIDNARVLKSVKGKRWLIKRERTPPGGLQ